MTTSATSIVHFRDSPHRSMHRYLHKYYLPQELKRRITPIDIYALEDGHNYRWGNRVPRHLPECRIHYEDIGLDKVVPGDAARQVLLAVKRYRADCTARLTKAEDRAALHLNAWLAEWEKKVLAELIRTTETLECQVRNGDPWMDDYELSLEISFHVRGDDPYSEENNPTASMDDIDQDAMQICTTKLLGFGVVSRAEAASPDYWGVGDHQDHNDMGHRAEGIYQVRHCATFHELYSHQHIPMKHLGRIGNVFAEITVWKQQGFTIDLATVEITVCKDEPRIREQITL